MGEWQITLLCALIAAVTSAIISIWTKSLDSKANILANERSKWISDIRSIFPEYLSTTDMAIREQFASRLILYLNPNNSKDKEIKKMLMESIANPDLDINKRELTICFQEVVNETNEQMKRDIKITNFRESHIIGVYGILMLGVLFYAFHYGLPDPGASEISWSVEKILILVAVIVFVVLFGLLFLKVSSEENRKSR